MREGSRYSVITDSLPRRLSPETARMTASQSPVFSVPIPRCAASSVSALSRTTTWRFPCSSSPFTRAMRVPTLPRISTISRSGRRACTCAARRGDPVPTRAPVGRVSRVRLSRATRASRGSSRSRIAAMTSPGHGSAGKSLRECTATSTPPGVSPSRRRWRSAAAKTPVPPRVASGPVSTSPSVLTVVMSKDRVRSAPCSRE